MRSLCFVADRIEPVQPLLFELRREHRGDRQWPTAQLDQAVDQHIRGRPLLWIDPDKDGDRLRHSCEFKPYPFVRPGTAHPGVFEFAGAVASQAPPKPSLDWLQRPGHSAAPLSDGLSTA